MTFWNKWFESTVEFETPYKTFSDYITDAPISVYFNNDKIGELNKYVDLITTENGFRYEIYYNQHELQKLLDSYGIGKINMFKIFNGVDVNMYAGRVPVSDTIVNRLPVRVNFEGLDSVNIDYKVNIIETTSNYIIYDFDYDHILQTLDLEQYQWFNISDVSMDDDILVYHLSLKEYVTKPVLLDHLPAGELKVRLHIENGQVISDLYAYRDLLELVGDKLIRLCKRIKTVNPRHFSYGNKQEVILVTSEYDTTRFDAEELSLLTDFTLFLINNYINVTDTHVYQYLAEVEEAKKQSESINKTYDELDQLEKQLDEMIKPSQILDELEPVYNFETEHDIVDESHVASYEVENG